MATKPGRMKASHNGLLPIMSHDTLITWPCEIRGSFAEGALARKLLNRQRLLVCSTLLYFYSTLKLFKLTIKNTINI